MDNGTKTRNIGACKENVQLVIPLASITLWVVARNEAGEDDRGLCMLSKFYVTDDRSDPMTQFLLRGEDQKPGLYVRDGAQQ